MVEQKSCYGEEGAGQLEDRQQDSQGREAAGAVVILTGGCQHTGRLWLIENLNKLRRMVLSLLHLLCASEKWQEGREARH